MRFHREEDSEKRLRGIDICLDEHSFRKLRNFLLNSFGDVHDRLLSIL
jgi:hypothetical protein